VLVSVDEKTGIQAKSRKHPGSPARAGRDARREFEYVRHGTISIIAAMDVATGQVIAERIDRNDSATFIEFLAMLHQMIPPGLRLHLIMDNGSSHTSRDDLEAKITAFTIRHNKNARIPARDLRCAALA
jgi:hypothetical protein